MWLCVAPATAPPATLTTTIEANAPILHRLNTFASMGLSPIVPQRCSEVVKKLFAFDLIFQAYFEKALRAPFRLDRSTVWVYNTCEILHIEAM